jgi:hypothetical protein
MTTPDEYRQFADECMQAARDAENGRGAKGFSRHGQVMDKGCEPDDEWRGNRPACRAGRSQGFTLSRHWSGRAPRVRGSAESREPLIVAFRDAGAG